MTTMREILIKPATAWLVEWNYRAWRSEIGEPVPEDVLSPEEIELIRGDSNAIVTPFIKREPGNPPTAMNNALLALQDELGPEIVVFHLLLDDDEFSSMCNEIEAKAEKLLTQRKWEYLSSRDHGGQN